MNLVASPEVIADAASCPIHRMIDEVQEMIL